MNPKKRLKSFIEYLGIETKAFETKAELSNGFVNNVGYSIRLSTLDKIKKAFPELNTNWLNSGSGEMLENISIVEPEGSIVNNRIIRNKKPGLIPFYNADFMAGRSDIFYSDGIEHPDYYMDVPEFSGCIAFRAFGDSMEKIIKSSSVLFGYKMDDDWNETLEYGQIYGITLKNGLRYLKYIRKATDHRNYFLLKSENEKYDDFEIRKDKIKNLWLIQGWIDKRA